MKMYKSQSQCQVEGCKNSLSKQKGYFKRHRICRYHYALPEVLLDGVAVKFCQQCGRFQPVGDFDAGKKTCRRKLDQHNAYRRESRRKAAEEDAARQAKFSLGLSSAGELQTSVSQDPETVSTAEPRILFSYVEEIGHRQEINAKTATVGPPPATCVEASSAFASSHHTTDFLTDHELKQAFEIFGDEDSETSIEGLYSGVAMADSNADRLLLFQPWSFEYPY